MMTSGPPPVAGLNDALALIRLAQDPAAVKKALDTFAQAAAEAAAATKSLQDAQAADTSAMDARTKALDARDAKLLADLESLDSAQLDFSAHQKALDERAAHLDERANSLVSRERALNDARALITVDQEAVKAAQADLAEQQTVFDKACAVHAQELQAREDSLAAAEKDYEARIARLREVVA